MAKIGCKCRPGVYGGRPAVSIDNILDWQFDVAAPEEAWVRGHHLHPNLQALRLQRGRHRPQFPMVHRGDAEPTDRGRRFAYGRVEAKASSTVSTVHVMSCCRPTIFSIYSFISTVYRNFVDRDVFDGGARNMRNLRMEVSWRETWCRSCPAGEGAPAFRSGAPAEDSHRRLIFMLRKRLKRTPSNKDKALLLAYVVG